LVRRQFKIGLHTLKLGVESRFRPMLHELSVRGLLIALRGRSHHETGNGESARSGHARRKISLGESQVVFRF
jgi:hypothetical protein